jgi:hypothetical protein
MLQPQKQLTINLAAFFTHLHSSSFCINFNKACFCLWVLQAYHSLKSPLKPASQCLLFYHMLIQPLTDHNFQEIAAALEYSNMTITCAAEELAASGLCKVEGTKDKKLIFNGSREELWNKGKNLFISPVKKVMYTSSCPDTDEILISYVSALAQYTNIASDRWLSYAISSDVYKKLKENNRMEELDQSTGDYRIEDWHYKPALLARDKYVDPLSLYLALEGEEGDRTRMAMDELIEKAL